MDTERLPHWVWLLVGLFGAAVLAQLFTVIVLLPLGLPEAYMIVPMIAAMTPVIVYLKIWLDEEKHEYWDHSRGRIASDLTFVVVGAGLASATVMVAIVDTGISSILKDVLSMFAGFFAGWALFWWRNFDIYRGE